MMDGDYPLLHTSKAMMFFLFIYSCIFTSIHHQVVYFILFFFLLPAWGGCRRWKQIPGSSPPRDHATSRLSWRWRGFPDPGHLSLWRSRVRGTCALCRDGWPIIFQEGRNITIIPSADPSPDWRGDERNDKKKRWETCLKPFHRRMWLWYTRRIATWPGSRWRRTAVARRRPWNDAGSLCGQGLWRRRFASCTYWTNRPPDGPKGSTDLLRCRLNAPLDCWHWNLSGKSKFQYPYFSKEITNRRETGRPTELQEPSIFASVYINITWHHGTPDPPLQGSRKPGSNEIRPAICSVSRS